MGNAHGRKREYQAIGEHDSLPRKRPRLRSRQHDVRLSWPSLPTRRREEEVERDLPLERCRSLERRSTVRPEILRAAISGPIKRPEYPVAWIEALFLPEFPTKSLVTEKSFVLQDELGSGAFGRVFRAVAKHDLNGVYALKIQEKSGAIAKNAVEQVKREAAVLRSLPPHVFVARLYATWQSRARLFSVLQYPPGAMGDLFTLWRDRGNFSEATLRIYGAELACAIDFIHRNNIIYRDLKLENVILDCAGHVKLVDFGLAKHLPLQSKTSTICGTLQYMSPCVCSGLPYDHSVDWWSLAVVMHVLLTGRYPYPNAEARHHLDLRFMDYSTPRGCSSQLGNLLDRMLAVPEDRRLSSFEVFHAHVFFHSIDFEKVEQRKYDPLQTMTWNRKRRAEEDVRSTLDGEENVTAFDEEYEFIDFEFSNRP